MTSAGPHRRLAAALKHAAQTSSESTLSTSPATHVSVAKAPASSAPASTHSGRLRAPQAGNMVEHLAALRSAGSAALARIAQLTAADRERARAATQAAMRADWIREYSALRKRAVLLADVVASVCGSESLADHGSGCSPQRQGSSHVSAESELAVVVEQLQAMPRCDAVARVGAIVCSTRDAECEWSGRRTAIQSDSMASVCDDNLEDSNLAATEVDEATDADDGLAVPMTVRQASSAVLAAADADTLTNVQDFLAELCSEFVAVDDETSERLAAWEKDAEHTLHEHACTSWPWNERALCESILEFSQGGRPLATVVSRLLTHLPHRSRHEISEFMVWREHVRHLQRRRSAIISVTGTCSCFCHTQTSLCSHCSTRVCVMMLTNAHAIIVARTRIALQYRTACSCLHRVLFCCGATEAGRIR
jgi:hypothetical protein